MSRKRHSKRITLMTLDAEGRQINSFNEGEYTEIGLQGALEDAACAAANPNGFFNTVRETHIAVCVFPLPSTGSTLRPVRQCRVVGKPFPIQKHESSTCFKWTFEVEVGATVVADGLDFQRITLEHALLRAFPFVMGDTFKVNVLSAPSREEILRVQGYEDGGES